MRLVLVLMCEPLFQPNVGFNPSASRCVAWTAELCWLCLLLKLARRWYVLMDGVCMLFTTCSRMSRVEVGVNFARRVQVIALDSRAPCAYQTGLDMLRNANEPSSGTPACAFFANDRMLHTGSESRRLPVPNLLLLFFFHPHLCPSPHGSYDPSKFPHTIAAQSRPGKQADEAPTRSPAGRKHLSLLHGSTFKPFFAARALQTPPPLYSWCSLLLHIRICCVFVVNAM